ncbi:tetratricopeptide repeat protein [Sphingomonas morindae]|uniref:Sel1 repeat family protein n=1 Tax=Sphingomonas morindae TaxID=1541170 RepID=A0ABY4X7L4_9SPHN|nr:tetratricopeptide repeat protein [Sphingomonas morindae]USI72881.1 sel1 repeat family protein [Sphingomonas morindae]
MADWLALLDQPSCDRLAALRSGAEAGLVEAQVRYGEALLAGHGCDADSVEALRWFILASHADHPAAINMVGRCHENGWGVAQDLAIAARCFARAAAAGYNWGMYNYAGALGRGAGIAQDEAAALRWFRRAADLGHVKSIGILGALAEEGRLVPRDFAEADRCYRIAADGGDFRSQFHLARRLAQSGAHDQAARWLERAWSGAHDAYRAKMREELAGDPEPMVRRLVGLLPAD